MYSDVLQTISHESENKNRKVNTRFLARAFVPCFNLIILFYYTQKAVLYYDAINNYFLKYEIKTLKKNVFKLVY